MTKAAYRRRADHRRRIRGEALNACILMTSEDEQCKIHARGRMYGAKPLGIGLETATSERSIFCEALPVRTSLLVDLAHRLHCSA